MTKMMVWAFGSLLLIVGLYQLYGLVVSRNWPQGTGTITKVEVVTDHDSENGTTYTVAVSYDYIVNGVRLMGNRIGFNERWYDRKEQAKAEVERYRVNTSVPVYYDPENPVDVVLVRESPHYILCIVLGIVLLGGVVWALLYRRAGGGQDHAG